MEAAVGASQILQGIAAAVIQFPNPMIFFSHMIENVRTSSSLEFKVSTWKGIKSTKRTQIGMLQSQPAT